VNRVANILEMGAGFRQGVLLAETMTRKPLMPPTEPMEPCAFCGDPDATHRLRDAIYSRYVAGETVNDLAHDYGMTLAEIGRVIRPSARRAL